MSSIGGVDVEIREDLADFEDEFNCETARTIHCEKRATWIAECLKCSDTVRLCSEHCESAQQFSYLHCHICGTSGPIDEQYDFFPLNP